ncbi:MAG: hypothetical protein LBK82_07585 [Planctomycetaceae bacterium]|jgi:hypothetical protein|nr:hypothetical protein [Planctomycetaceae bacterium]
MKKKEYQSQKKLNRYEKLIEEVFFKNYKNGASEVLFLREEFLATAEKLEIELPKNIGDVIYSFRFRTNFPDSIVKLAPSGMEWVLRLVGKGKYQFSLAQNSRIIPNPHLAETKIPDATPGIIKRYVQDDEQALLAKLRYNRLIDVFTGITCYSLQNHLRTSVVDLGQVETDELYVGIDKYGTHYILPIQAKVSNDQLGIVQMEQDFALCKEKFPVLVCLPIAAKLIEKELIALFSFEQTDKGISMISEKHYRLVDTNDLSEKEIRRYKFRCED